MLVSGNDHLGLTEVRAPGLPRPVAADAARRINPRRELVARAIRLLGDRVNEPVSMVELSRLTGVSERTLRAAFHDIVGLSPKQFALAQRLRAAREALRAADPDTTTVTDIATAYGFFELGRFAERYRHAFGEVPSHTLHQVAARWPRQAA
jgi:transcriptional regulator GlxA family with amidase domain